MSTFVPSVIDEKLFEVTKKDSVAAFAPKNTGMIAGALSGAVAPWLPALIYFPPGWVYKYLLGEKYMTSGEKMQAATKWLTDTLGGYASVAIWITLALAALGVLMGILRQRSALQNKYLSWAMAKYGNMRMGQDAQLTIVLVPVLILLGLLVTDSYQSLFLAIFPIAASGLVYYAYWLRLDNFFLKVLYRTSWHEATSHALRLMIPRTLGWKNCKVKSLEINTEKKDVHLVGEFPSKDVELDARNIVEHYLRGYHPVYVENNADQAS